MPPTKKFTVKAPTAKTEKTVKKLVPKKTVKVEKTAEPPEKEVEKSERKKFEPFTVIPIEDETLQDDSTPYGKSGKEILDLHMTAGLKRIISTGTDSIRTDDKKFRVSGSAPLALASVMAVLVNDLCAKLAATLNEKKRRTIQENDVKNLLGENAPTSEEFFFLISPFRNYVKSQFDHSVAINDEARKMIQTYVEQYLVKVSKNAAYLLKNANTVGAWEINSVILIVRDFA